MRMLPFAPPKVHSGLRAFNDSRGGWDMLRSSEVKQMKARLIRYGVTAVVPLTSPALCPVQTGNFMNSSRLPNTQRVVAVSAAFFAIFGVATLAQTIPQKKPAAQQVPLYKVDAAWPKPLPNQWIIGPVCGVAVDSHENVWIVQRRVNLAPGRPRRGFRAAGLGILSRRHASLLLGRSGSWV